MTTNGLTMYRSPTQEQCGDESALSYKTWHSSSALTPHLCGESSSDENSTDSSSLWSNPQLTQTWHANPQSPNSTSSSLSSSHGKRTSVALQQRRHPFFVICLFFIGIAAIFISQTTLGQASKKVSGLEARKVRINGKLEQYEKEIRMMSRKISAMDSMIQKQHNLDAQTYQRHADTQKALNELKDLQHRIQVDSIRARRLKNTVQMLSRDDIIEKYGYGEHKVEVELVFPDQHHRGPTKFVIQLAPASMMPHSVHTFLEMTSLGLLDGCSFILNAMHVLKVAPLPYDGSSAAEKAKNFAEKGLESVAFKEYNKNYPHKKYTVGFAADGSPSFYINTEDNSEIHVGDPCFGKVIEGFETIARLEAMPTRNGIWFERRIGIKSARLLLNE